MSAHRRATAQDVADLAGVSRSAVSLVLNGRASGIVAPAKQAAVVEAARQLDYRPNTVALSLRSQRSWTVGALTWKGVTGFPDDLLATAGRAIRSAGFLSILIAVSPGAGDLEEALPSLIDRRVEGLIVVAPSLDRVEVPEMVGSLPTVMINCLDPTGQRTSVVPDEHGSAACATELLIERGHTRFAILADDTGSVQSTERIAGARRAAEVAGIANPRVLHGGPTVRDGAALARAVLSAPEPPTALLCLRERLAVGALLAARDLDLRVPEDLSLITMEDGTGLSGDLTPEMARMQRPDRAMAEQAIALLLDEINDPAGHEARHLSFACPPELGGSVRAI